MASAVRDLVREARAYLDLLELDEHYHQAQRRLLEAAGWRENKHGEWWDSTDPDPTARLRFMPIRAALGFARGQARDAIKREWLRYPCDAVSPHHQHCQAQAGEWCAAAESPWLTAPSRKPGAAG